MRLPKLSALDLLLWAVFTFIALLTVLPPIDYDMWWHLRSGEWMVQNGQILSNDWFSYTYYGAERVSYDWLAQIFLYYVWAVGDEVALGLVTALFSTIALIIMYKTVEGNIYIRLLVLSVAVLVSAPAWLTRPQLFSLIFSAAIIWVIYRYKSGISARWLWVMPPIFIAWANLHGGWSIIAGVMVLTAIGEGLNRLTGTHARHTMSWKRLRDYVGVSAVSAAGLFINPFGIATVLVPIVVLNSPSSIEVVQEWQPADFSARYGMPLLIMIILLVVSLLMQIIQRRLDWTQALTGIALLIMVLQYRRTLAFFAMVAMPIIVMEMSRWIEMTRWRKRLNYKPTPPQGRGQIFYRAVWVLILVAGIITAAWRLSPERMILRQQVNLPVYAMEALLREQPPGNVFNDYGWGGYHVWKAREYPVFIDGRVDIYTDFIFTWREADRGNEWEDLFEEWDINTALFRVSAGLADVLRERDDWKILHEDEWAILFTRVQDAE